MSDTFGHLSKSECCVCGARTKKNQIEPRFGYTVCEEHQRVPPTQVHRREPSDPNCICFSKPKKAKSS